MAELVIQTGALQGKKLVLPAKEMIIGRDDGCDMKIASSLVSRKHCSLRSTPEGIVVTDLGSQNGTHVNDVAITEPTLLKEGDYLRIGAIQLSVPISPKTKSSAAIAQQKVSESEIADWLTDSGSNYTGGDTAIIGINPQQKAQPPAKSVADLPAAKPQAPKVLSVKDEAAAVIKKHWESVKAKQQT